MKMDIIIDEDCEIYYDRIIVGDKHYTTIGITPVKRLVINGFAKCLTDYIYIVADEIIMPHTNCECIVVKCKNITIESTQSDGIVGYDDDNFDINLISNTMTKRGKYIFSAYAMYDIYKTEHTNSIEEYLEDADECINVNGVNIYTLDYATESDTYCFIKNGELYEIDPPRDCREHVIEMLPEFVERFAK